MLAENPMAQRKGYRARYDVGLEDAMTPDEMMAGWSEMVTAYRDAWQRVFTSPQATPDEAEAVLGSARTRMDEMARAAERSVAGRFTGADGNLQSELREAGQRMERIMERIASLETALAGAMAGSPSNDLAAGTRPGKSKKARGGKKKGKK